MDLRYELVLNSELYKSFYIVFIPIGLCLYTILYLHDKETNLTIFAIKSLIFGVVFYFGGKYWLYEKYGKYIQKISKIVAEIIGEEDGFEYDRSFLKIQKEFVFLQKIRNFCNEKFGKYGQIAYIIFLIILVFLISFLVGICIVIRHYINKLPPLNQRIKQPKQKNLIFFVTISNQRILIIGIHSYIITCQSL